MAHASDRNGVRHAARPASSRATHSARGAADRALVSGWVRDGVLGPWPPPIERVQPLIERLDELSKGVVIVSGAARREQVDHAVDDALDAIYPADERERIASLFEETAYVWWQSKREGDARQALAAAADFRTCEPRDNPCRACDDRTIVVARACARAARRAIPLPLEERNETPIRAWTTQ
jgi:hypothetical protein